MIGTESNSSGAKVKRELKPCPFCGGEAEYSRGSLSHNWVFCMNCVAEKTKDGARSGFYETQEQAANAWNTRVVSNTQIELVGSEVTR